MLLTNSDNMTSQISVVAVGDSQCGKTQLINRFANGSFSEVRLAIIGDLLMYSL